MSFFGVKMFPPIDMRKSKKVEKAVLFLKTRPWPGEGHFLDPKKGYILEVIPTSIGLD
jgi:hypothetical protein